MFDPDVERRTKFAEAWDAVAARSMDAVLDESDAVFVCTWTSEHPAAVAACVAAGLPVFCEKPLAVDLDGARAMAELVDRSSLVNMVGLVLRSQPALLALREMVRDPSSGALMNVVFRDDQYIPVQGMYGSTWRADRALAGSGTLLEHSIHDVDLLEWLCGPVASVSAHTSNHHGHDGIEDSVSALLRFEGGHTATLASIWHDVLERPSLRRLEVFCRERHLTLEREQAGPLHWERTGEVGSLEGDELRSWLADRGVTPTIAEDDFLRRVRCGDGGGEPAGPTFADALRAHELVDAIYRSAASGGAPVDVGRTAEERRRGSPKGEPEPKRRGHRGEPS